MSRTFPILIAASLLMVDQAYAQHAQHDEVEIIDSPAFRSSDEKKPDLDAVTKSIVERTNAFRATEGRPRLSVNTKVAKAAREFAAYMASTGPLRTYGRWPRAGRSPRQARLRILHRFGEHRLRLRFQGIHIRCADEQLCRRMEAVSGPSKEHARPGRDRDRRGRGPQ